MKYLMILTLALVGCTKKYVADAAIPEPQSKVTVLCNQTGTVGLTINCGKVEGKNSVWISP